MKYYSMLGESTGEFIEKKSRFIGFIKRVETEEEALDFIDDKKTKYYDATHNTYAYIIGEDKNIQRYSDDGEPSGTAGVPMLEVLKKEDMTNVVTVVTRYFGGTMLGAGGLVRAYTRGVVEAINGGTKILIKSMNRTLFTYEYTAHGAITNYLITNGYKVIEESYTDMVSVTIDVAQEDKKIFEDMNDMTSGNVEVKTLRELILPTKDEKIIYEV